MQLRTLRSNLSGNSFSRILLSRNQNDAKPPAICIVVFYDRDRVVFMQSRDFRLLTFCVFHPVSKILNPSTFHVLIYVASPACMHFNAQC
jgi:hypothetical protein